MPTVILLDSSISMNMHFSPIEGGTKLELAVEGLNSLLDFISIYCRLEFISLVSYSSQWEVLCSFTRDTSHIKYKLCKIKANDIAYLDEALNGVEKMVVGEWGYGTSCNVILVTQDNNLNRHTLPFSFPGNFIVVMLNALKGHMIYPADEINQNYRIYQPDLLLNLSSVLSLFESICNDYYTSWTGQLICGNFSSKVSLSPTPVPHTKVTDFDSGTYKVDNVLEICGFLELQHLGCPAAVSRHLVLPYSMIPVIGLSPPLSLSQDSDDDFDEGQTASFCVLLHGALKVENMAALCSVGNNWYGVLYSWADSKKKSNLMLSLLEPGPEPVPWLGDLNNLTVPGSNLYVDSFPLKPLEKRSYAQNCIAWIRQPGLQSDIQKILRHARKLPDKTQQFYKELNRVRRAAICLGFMVLIEGLADILERECTQLPGSAHPACAFQLTHAAGVLREPYSKDPKYNIMPMKMHF